MSQALSLSRALGAADSSAAHDVASAGPGTSSWSWLAGKPAAWTLLSVLTLGAVAVSYPSRRAVDDAQTRSTRPTNAADTRPVPAAVVHETTEPTGDVPAATPAAANVAALARAPAAQRNANATRARTPAPSDHLSEEIALLDRARFALGHGEPARALDVLLLHTRRYADGVLLPEAEALRIEALLARGDGPEGRARMERFLRAYPDSPLTTRLTRLAAQAATADREQPAR